jgi:hypothetical protein
VGRAIGPGGPDGPSRAVLLTGVEIRRYVRRLVETDHPGIAVLSFQELAPEAQIRPSRASASEGARRCAWAETAPPSEPVAGGTEPLRGSDLVDG